MRNKGFRLLDTDRMTTAEVQSYVATGDRLPRFDHFEYRTPLNGGDGFTWAGEDILIPDEHPWGFTRGQHYRSSETDIHTLDIRCEGTVIMLEQLADVVPLDQPTNAWCRAGDRRSPDLSGLYDHMDPDHARKRLGQFLDLIGNR